MTSRRLANRKLAQGEPAWSMIDHPGGLPAYSKNAPGAGSAIVESWAMGAITSRCGTRSRRRANLRKRRRPVKSLKHEVDFGCGFARHAGTGFALGVAFQYAAPPQHILAHRKPCAGLLLVAHQRQM